MFACSDCGAKLTRRYHLVQEKWVDDSYVCSNYRKLARECSIHYITTQKMETAILAVIQRVSWYVRHNEKEFIQRVREASTVRQEEAFKGCEQQLSLSKRRHSELDGLVKKLYEANATGKLNDRHFERLMGEYDSEQSALETTMTELQGQIDAWSENKLKTDEFIELVKRYTDFTELTTPMLNEFIEKVIVYEGEGRGNDRRQRVDVFMNFIGAFEVPADSIAPMELEEQRRLTEEKAAHERELKQRAQARCKKRNQERRDFTARMKAGLLTSEELEAHEQHKAKNRAWQKEWRDKRKAAMPEQSQKVSRSVIIKRKKDGLPLTPEELEIYETWRRKRTAQHREWRHGIKAKTTA